MADNIDVTPGVGATIATDEVDGVQYQRVKVAWGVDGQAADVSAAAPLPVDGSGVTQPVSAVSLPLPAGAATAAKQPALGTAGHPSADVLTIQGAESMVPLKVDASGFTISASLSGMMPVTGIFWPDTQQVSAAALPLPTGAATEKKQDDLITLLGEPLQDGGTVQVGGTVEVTGTFWQAVQPISVAILPLPLGAATAEKQASPGTPGAASHDVVTVQGVTSMVPLRIDGSGVVQPVSISGSLPAFADSPSVTVNHLYFDVTGAPLTRPANTTAYSTGDSISDNATIGLVTALSTNDLSSADDSPVSVTEILLDTTDTGPGTAGVEIQLHLFNVNPTANSGVRAGDNATWSNKRSGWVGSFSGQMTAFSDGSRGVLTPETGHARIVFPASGTRHLYYQLATLGDFTPSAASTVFTPTFIGWPGR